MKLWNWIKAGSPGPDLKIKKLKSTNPTKCAYCLTGLEAAAVTCFKTGLFFHIECYELHKNRNHHAEAERTATEQSNIDNQSQILKSIDNILNDLLLNGENK